MRGNPIRAVKPGGKNSLGSPRQRAAHPGKLSNFPAFFPMSQPPLINVQYRRGVYLPAHDLWLDPADSQNFAFVSHAHADHIGRHEETVLSTITARLMHARLPGKRHEHRLEFGQPDDSIRPGLRMTLYPAGHISSKKWKPVPASSTRATSSCVPAFPPSPPVGPTPIR